MSVVSCSTTSTTAYKVTADTTGTLVLQTGSTPTTAVTIDTSQNMGVGTSSPSTRLHLAGTASPTITFTSSSGPYSYFESNTVGSVGIAADEGNTGASSNINFRVDGTERARIDASGNLMVGGTSTAAKFAVANNTNDGTYSVRIYGVMGTSTTYLDSDAADLWGGGLGEFQIQNGTATRPAMLSMGGSVNAAEGMGVINFFRSGNDNTFKSRAQIAGVLTNTGTANRYGGCLTFRTASDSATSPSERARIDENGNLLVGTTSPLNSSALRAANNGIAIRPIGQYIASCTDSYCAVFNVNSTNTGQVLFQNNGVSVGSITSTGSATTYATSSDYRLKENIQPIAGALATVDQLNPVTYNWKADGSEGQGFIAHELQAVVPDCVTGEKDAVDADGNPVYQGIDTSFLVATLTAAIQEQQALITTLTERITALENK